MTKKVYVEILMELPDEVNLSIEEVDKFLGEHVNTDTDIVRILYVSGLSVWPYVPRED